MFALFSLWLKTWKFTKEKLLKETLRAESAECAQRQPERSWEGRKGEEGKTKLTGSMWRRQAKGQGVTHRVKVNIPAEKLSFQSL